MVKLIKAQIEELRELDKQRIAWLRISGFVAVAIIAVIVDWHYVKNTGWGWLLVSTGLAVSAIWWYWTMIVVRKILHQKSLESEALIDLINDIKEIKQEVKKFTKPLDNIK